MSTFKIKRNDTRRALEVTLLDSAGSPVSLAGASVRFHMRERAGATLKVDADATIVEALAGTCKYTWNPSDTDTEGKFQAEFEVTYADGGIETFPSDDYITVSIGEDLG